MPVLGSMPARGGPGRPASAAAPTAPSPQRQRNAHIDRLPMPFSVDHKAAGGYGFPPTCRRVALWEMHLEQRMHLARVKSIKMCVDNSPPRSAATGKAHEERRRKSRQLEAARIERDNAILICNMYRMLHEPSRYPVLSEDTERGRANKRHVSVAQREFSLKQVNEKNERMLKMIIGTGPDIDFSRLDQEWKVTQRRMSSASKMPWVVGELPDVPEHARKHVNHAPTSLAATASMKDLHRRKQSPGSAGGRGRAWQSASPERALEWGWKDGVRQQVEAGVRAMEASLASAAGMRMEAHVSSGVQAQALPSHPASREAHPPPATAGEPAAGVVAC
jgi:hypothetical protein